MSDWESWVGRETTSESWLDPAQANRMNVTLDRAPSFGEGDPLPPGWHWLYFHDVIRSSDLGDDGHPRLGVTMPPVPLPRRMWAGGSLEFLAPLRLGAPARRVSRIQAITPKQGRSGPLFFVALEHELLAEGVTCLRERQTVVYRDMTPAGPAGPADSAEAPPADADLHASWRLDSTALFRYSALTFNGHRIHYDADYCRDVEGYPGLVIHGPLLATLLLDLAAEHRRPLRRFAYRARAPLFVPEPFTTNGAITGDGTRLWVAGETRVAMEAEASGEP